MIPSQTSLRPPAFASTPDADNPACILIVDDELFNRQVLEVMLARPGYVISTATTGEEALAMVGTHPPDLILLDVMMPGLDGYQVVARIKADPATAKIPVIMVTALDDRRAKMLAQLAGAEDFLTKPVERAELEVRVRNLLRLKAYSDYHDRYSRALEGEATSREEQLVQSESLYRDTFDGAPVGIIHSDADGLWLRVNQRACDFLGYTCEELVGLGGAELTKAEQPVDEAETLRHLASGQITHTLTGERRYQRSDGTLVWARVNVSVHRDARGRFQHFITVIEDITDRRTLEARVRQANRMDAVGRLASGIAHDFNNLLTVILGFAELAAGDDEEASEHGQELREIIKAARSAAGLTKQLLAFSREQVLTPEPLDVNALITDTVGMLDRLIGKHIEIVLRLAPQLPTAHSDQGQLQQVLMNLASNARDAMPNGGTLLIETSAVDLVNSAALPEEVVEAPYVLIAVTDTGEGMSSEVLAHVFEPFFTTKDIGKGTGLGLATIYGIIKQSHGYIWVDSMLGRGTTFKVFLPRSEVSLPHGTDPHGMD